MFRLKSQQDFGAGILFMLIGFAGVYFGGNLVYGSASHIGPGFFPRWISWMIVALGALIALRGVAIEGPAIAVPSVRPILFVVAAVLIFGVLVTRVGLAITTAVLTIVAAYARPKVDLKETFLFAVLLAVVATVAFVYGLGQPLPAWWGDN